MSVGILYPPQHLKKAFDMVAHSMLIPKLKSLGVLKESIPWFESYLMDRKQRTKVDDVVLECCVITHGVPQGSILGPLLLLIHINDLCDTIELCGTSMYANDTAIFYFSNDIDDEHLGLQHDMQSVSFCMLHNGLSLNVKKTKLMMVGNMHGFKYLGLIPDNHLCFDKHIDDIVYKSMNKLGVLYETRWLFDLSTARKLYCNFVTPHFDLQFTVYVVAEQYQLN